MVHRIGDRWQPHNCVAAIETNGYPMFRVIVPAGTGQGITIERIGAVAHWPGVMNGDFTYLGNYAKNENFTRLYDKLVS